MFKKLNDHRSAQCKVQIAENGNLCFWSYATPVIEIVYQAGKRMVCCTGTYSATTSRQIGWFLREYAPDLSYYDMKAIVGEGLVEM